MDAEEVKLVTEIDQRSRSNTHRLNRLEERMDKLEVVGTTVAGMQVELTHVLETVQEIKAAVLKIQEKPGKWWEKLILAVMTALVGYLIALATGTGGGAG